MATIDLQGQADGTSSFSGVLGLDMIFTGITGGSGELIYSPYVDFDGQIDGVGDISGDPYYVVGFSGSISGTSDFQISYPLPIHGTSSFSGILEIISHTVYGATTCPSKCFRYMEFFQREDLAIYIRNAAGPVSPVRVVYTLYQKRPDGTRFQVGPSRLPVSGDVGEYYATGRAGELGQPGDWVIVWEYQESRQVKPQYKEMTFRVSDAVMADSPQDTTVRCRKYGWS